MPPRQDSEAHEQWLDEIIPLTEAAALRRISVETLRRQIKLGQLRMIKLGVRKRGMQRREALRSLRA